MYVLRNRRISEWIIWFDFNILFIKDRHRQLAYPEETLKATGALLLRIHWKRVDEVFPHKLKGNKALSFSAVAALLLYRYI